MTQLTIAQKIAAALDNDGMQWRTRPTDDSEPQTFEELIEAHGGASLEWRDGYRTGDTVRYSFSDGSMITVWGEAWDYGFADCFCWAGCPDDECDNPAHGALAHAARRHLEANNAESQDDGSVVYYDDATQTWYRSPVEDLPRLGELLRNDPDNIGYSLWCSETFHEQVSSDAD